MKTIKNFFLNYAWVIYLGISLAQFAEYTLSDWEYWAIVIPLCFLEPLHRLADEKKNNIEKDK